MSLFKSFQPSKGDIASSTAVKSSVQRGMRQKLLEQYPSLSQDEGILLEQIWPKKQGITLVKFSREHVSFLVNQGEPLFFQHFDGPYMPTLHLLHKYPFLLPSIQVDRGAIKFLLSGANVMAPGLLTAGGRLPDPGKGEIALPEGAPVAIMAQDKESALSIGILRLGTDEIRSKGKGSVVDNIHYLGGELLRERVERRSMELTFSSSFRRFVDLMRKGRFLMTDIAYHAIVLLQHFIKLFDCSLIIIKRHTSNNIC
ncbi:hypothetical protein L7F22_019037 [Adiantum nelumboides]|nr:hypothetical protein [Adiantum nelumboides]